MSDLFFFDEAHPPKPPSETRIENLKAEPYPEGNRVRISVTITPFLQRPNLEIFAQQVDGPIVAEMSVIETMTPSLDFTMHIRGVETLAGDYILRAELYYEDRQHPQDACEITFQISPPDSEPRSIDD